MGDCKNRLMEVEERGYGESDKYICSGCIRDEYLVKKIHEHGQNGKCSFCKDALGRPNRSRKVYSLESLMKYIMPAIRYYYMSADGNLPYDDEICQYLGDTIDTYDFIQELVRSVTEMSSFMRIIKN